MGKTEIDKLNQVREKNQDGIFKMIKTSMEGKSQKELTRLWKENQQQIAKVRAEAIKYLTESHDLSDDE